MTLDAGGGRRAGSYLSRYTRSHALEIADTLVVAAASPAGFVLRTLSRRDHPMPDMRFCEPV